MMNNKKNSINSISQIRARFATSAWLIWGLGAAFFFCEYFARVAPSVMVSELMRDFRVDAFTLGSLSAFFYYAYVSMQVPVGMLVDRFGAHKLLTTMSLLCGVGAFIFSQAHSIHIAELGRLLTGFAAAFAFVGALKLASVWFPPEKFGLLAGLTQALGMLGAAVGEAPMAVLVQGIGWRETMILIASVFVVLAGFIGLFVRDFPRPLSPIAKKIAIGAASHRSHANVSMRRSLWIVLKNPQSWANAIYAGMVYGPTAAFAELWGVSFLKQAHHLTTDVAAGAISLIFIGWGFGGPLFGWISDKILRRKPLMFASALFGLVFISAVIYLPGIPTSLLYTLTFLYGLTNAGVAVSYAVASEINPRAVAGTSMAWCNMGSVIIGALFQPVIGKILDHYWNHVMHNGVRVYSTHDYQIAFSVLPIFFIVGIISLFLIKETRCKIFDESQRQGNNRHVPRQTNLQLFSPEGA